MEAIKQFWHKHPYWAIALGIGIVVLIYLMFFRGSSAPASGGNPNAAAYWNTEAAAIASGNQVQEAQLAAQAAVDQAQLQTQAISNIYSTVYGSQVSMNNSNNSSALAEAENANRMLFGLAQLEAPIQLQTLREQQWGGWKPNPPSLGLP